LVKRYPVPNLKEMMKVPLKSVSAICMLILFLFSIACKKQTIQWKGTITAENGVTVVQNPKDPMYGGDVLALEEDLSIGEATTKGDFLFSTIRSLAVDDAGNIYVLDEKENHVLAFDSTGNHLRTFGRAGQGPGEFSLALTMGLTNRDEIVIEDYRNRLVYYSTEGEHIRDIPCAKTGVRRVTVDSSGNILGIVIVRDEERSRYELNKYDPELNLLHNLGSTPTPSSSNEGFDPFSGTIYYTFDKDDRVVSGVPDRYEIKIFDTAGNLDKKITRDYDPVEITEEEKKEVEEEMPQEIKLKIPKYHNAFRRFSTDDEGRIFVMTWEHIQGSEWYYYDVFDSEGRYLAKIPLEFRPLVIKKNKFYAVREDEDGFHIVKRYKANWRFDE
jgi:hypothetical protein